MKKPLALVLLFLLHITQAQDSSADKFQNPLSVLNYGDIGEISWYGWFVIVYSFFVVVIVGSAIFLP